MSIYKSSSVLNKVLEKILPPVLTHLIGDLEEELQENLEIHPAVKAHALFWFRFVKSAPYLLYESFKWNIIMIFNYLKVAIRNIKKYKVFSAINILGLAASLSVCLLIILFIYDQKSYDRFHEDKDRIYRVTTDFKSQGNLSSQRYATSPANLSEILREEYPSIEEATIIRRRISGEAEANGKVIRVNGLYTDPGFFDVFSFQMVSGNPETALQYPGSIVLSKETAVKFFGEENPIGKAFNVTGRGDFTITGVVDTDVRTHISFDLLASYSTLLADEEYKSIYIDNWRNSFYSSYTYFKLRERRSVTELSDHFPGLISSKYDATEESYISEFIIQPLSQISMGDTMDNQLGSVMPREPLFFLLGFAGIIIFVACFNYVGLTVARSLSRGKEVGVRKALGANKGSVMKQFLIEASVISICSFVFALALLYYLLPEFNNLQFVRMELSRKVSVDFIQDFEIYVGFIVFTLFVGLIAGLFPALHLSSLKSAVVLKGLENIKGLSRSYIRKALVVIQFAFSVMFVITAIVLNKQFNHLVNSDYGFEQESIIHLELQDVPFDRVKDVLTRNTDIESISGTSIVPGLNSRRDRTVTSDFIDYNTRANHFSIDENYLENMKLELIAGRNFSPELGTDLHGPMIVSERTVEQLGFENPLNAIGRYVHFADSIYPVIGVVEDFVSSDVTGEKEAVIIQYQPDWIETASIRVLPGKTTDVFGFIQEEWASLGSIYEVDATVYSEELKGAFSLALFTDMIKMVRVAALFSIMISCLGLFGMAMFNAESRTKEIGIRKVLGAGDKDIVVLLSKEYAVLIGIAIALGIPCTYLLNNLLLQDIANRVVLTPSLFLAGTVITAALAMLTVGSQSIRAALANSVDNLKSE